MHYRSVQANPRYKRSPSALNDLQQISTMKHLSHNGNERPVAATVKLMAHIVAMTMLLAGCQKCETCSYSYTTSDGVKQYVFPEVCGEKYKRDIQEEACRTAAALAGTTCTCEKS